MSFALWHCVRVAPASRGVTLNLEREQVSEGGRNKGQAWAGGEGWGGGGVSRQSGKQGKQ